MTNDSQKDCCHAEIRITHHGNVNIYACSSPAGDRPPHSEEECAPVPPGQCVPLALGVKPKQSQRHKLDRLLAKNRVPSAFGAAFVQHVATVRVGPPARHPARGERFLLGRTSTAAEPQERSEVCARPV